MLGLQSKPQRHPKQATDQAADRKAALAFEKEQKRRERERAKEWKKEHERRQHAVDKAQSALDAARRKHEKNADDIQTQIEVLEEMSQAEDAHWEKEGNDWKLRCDG